MRRTVFYELPADKEDSSQHRPKRSENIMADFPPTYIVIRFARHLKPEALAWFLCKVRAKKENGGAELLVCRHSTGSSSTKGVSIHLSAHLDRLLEAAEEMEMCKRDTSGLVREFVWEQMSDFLADGMVADDLFTSAERQNIVLHELENLRAGYGEGNLPGYTSVKLYPGQSIFQLFKQQGFVDKFYPLHDGETIKKLGRAWYMTLFRNQPHEEIRLYFGESIALYFIFLGFYTKALVPPMLLGLLQTLIPHTTTVFFCLFNVIWVTVFLELWKRKSSELAFQWGTIGMTSLDEPRCEFRGVMGLDEVTGRYQPHFPRWKTNVRVYCCSFPLVVVCVAVAFWIMLLSFWVENLLVENRREAGDDSLFASVLILTPSVIYSAVVFVMNFYYRGLATALTEWENHRTQSQFDRHRVTKLVIFEFINNFVSLFYIAFIVQDMDMLRTQIATMLIVLQALNNVQETLLPLFIRRYGKKISNYFKSRRKHNRQEPVDDFYIKAEDFLYDVPKLPEDDSRVLQAVSEARMEPYEGTYDDYLEMFIQFGYVFLFSSVYPVASVWAVANNVFEIRTDAFKLCCVCQRPVPRRVKDIGAWQGAFEVVGALSVMTNCGLMCLSPQLRNLAPNTSQVEWVLLFLVIEHALLGVRYILHKTIPARSEWVRIALAKVDYQSKQALKHERAQKRRRVSSEISCS